MFEKECARGLRGRGAERRGGRTGLGKTIRSVSGSDGAGRGTRVSEKQDRKTRVLFRGKDCTDHEEYHIDICEFELAVVVTWGWYSECYSFCSVTWMKSILHWAACKYSGAPVPPGVNVPVSTDRCSCGVREQAVCGGQCDVIDVTWLMWCDRCDVTDVMWETHRGKWDHQAPHRVPERSSLVVTLWFSSWASDFAWKAVTVTECLAL